MRFLHLDFAPAGICGHNRKYGIPLSRYAVFMQNYPLERSPKVMLFLL
jgi:hypothetical protein